MADVAIGLTEGWVAGIARGEPVRIIGSYVQSPLRTDLPGHADIGWAISTGPESQYEQIPDLKGSSIAVSRIGSGSYVMPYVLADQNSWLEKGKDPFEFKVLNTFENMINSVRYEHPRRNY
jgi:ABC-type nitrate/sulfonate/bicarbonate transport system substrate-binding protein